MKDFNKSCKELYNLLNKEADVIQPIKVTGRQNVRKD